MKDHKSQPPPFPTSRKFRPSGLAKITLDSNLSCLRQYPRPGPRRERSWTSPNSPLCFCELISKIYYSNSTEHLTSSSHSTNLLPWTHLQTTLGCNLGEHVKYLFTFDNLVLGPSHVCALYLFNSGLIWLLFAHWAVKVNGQIKFNLNLIVWTSSLYRSLLPYFTSVILFYVCVSVCPSVCS